MLVMPVLGRQFWSLVSVLYLVPPENKLYTIDFLPKPKITYDTLNVDEGKDISGQ